MKYKTIINFSLCRYFLHQLVGIFLCAVLFAGSANGAIIFSDDFETGFSQWTRNGSGNAGTNTDTFQSPNRSLYLRGEAVEVISDPADASSGPSVRLSFWLRRGADSFSEDPDNNEDLVVYYRNDSGAWVELERFAGNGTPGEIFTRTYTLSSDALHANLSVRFDKEGGASGNYDYWHVDDVEIETFTAGPTSALVNYRFDEMFWTGTSGEVTDSSGNGNDAAAINGPDTEAVSPALPGNPGTCGYGVFNGQNQYVEYSNASTFLDGLSGVTVMAWVRNTDAIGHDRGIFTTGAPNGNDNRFALRYDEAGASSGNTNLLKASINTSACSDNSDCLQVETEGNLQVVNSWQHIAMTWESGDKIRIFIDGSEVQTTVTSSGIGVHNGTLDGVDFLRIGQSTKAGVPSPEWQGNIDEFRIYDAKLTGAQITQAMNEAHPCTAPLAEYRFEGCNWNTGSVVADELGSYPGVVVQGAHTAPGSDYGGGLCNVANLANEGSDFNRHISLDSNPIPLSGDWTLMAWINLPPVFDRHFNVGGYRYTVIAGGTNDLCWIRRRNSDGTMEWGASSNPSAHRAPFPGNLTGWHHLAFVGEGSTTSLYVDGTFYSSVNYKQTGSYTRIGTSADDAFISDNRRQNLDTQLDELKFYVGPLTAAEINGIYILENSGLRWNGAPLNCLPCVDVDHIRIEHTGIGLTCQSSTIDLRACSDAACTTETTTPVTVTMSPATASPPVWIGGDSYTFTGSQSVQLRQTVPGIVNLGISNTTPVPTNSYRCYDSGVEGDCDLEFFETGFIFDIPDLTACQQSPNVAIQAVRMDDTTQTCTAADGFAGVTKDVGFWSSYVNPVTGTEQVEINSTAIGSAGPGTPITLNFDASATATVQVRYPDAGQMQINTRYDGVGPDEIGLVMLGSDSFVSRPVGLCVYSDDPNSDCVSGNANCSVFRKVDEDFTLKVKGVCWESAGDSDFCTGNSTTSNFELSNIPISQNLIAPTSAGSSAGSLGVTSINITDVDSGEHVIANQTVSEVGVFTFTATPPDYFGEPLPAATSVNIGRFTPDHFETAIIDDGVLQDGCSGFTYTSQSFTYESPRFPEMEITATNSGGGTTVNYRDGFVKLTDPALQINMPPVTTDATNLGSDGSTPLNFTWTPGTSSLMANDDGTLTFTLGADQFIYTKESNALVAPFVTDIRLPVTSIVDTDAIAADDLPRSFTPTGTQIRYGRLLLQNAYGPETLPLTIPVYTEYYNGTAFVLNGEDDCTTYSAANVGLANFQGNLELNETLASGGGPLADGLSNDLILSAPGDDNHGSVEVTLNLGAAGLGWLQFDWDGDGSEDNPMARATFGIFSGNQDLIYMRESVW
ncbi:MAG: LamG domain-containing protein [Desulfocapsaceae bacterium]|nr:LamG domain-containing protein [Desulfocapsaceae bacterium]